ncbi:MAG: WecB/TagA/CpsF family glycosyltransferase, partial [Armatimonadetes bacterium]|nr:WecB/TagA/CpsF family glycosyltransferase [Armatimonadota bacterium]
MSTQVTAPPAPPRREVLGTAVHAVSLADALTWAAWRIEARRPGYVITLNGALLVQAARDPALRALVNDADLVTSDGVGVILAARILGVDISDRLAGIDLAIALCARAADAGWRLYLLGG